MKEKEKEAKRREIENEAELDSFSLSVCGAELHLTFSETIKRKVLIFCVHFR